MFQDILKSFSLKRKGKYIFIKLCKMAFATDLQNTGETVY